MKKNLVVSFLALALAATATAEVPEPFRGVWVLDEAASLEAIGAAGEQLTPEQSERLVRGVTTEMAGFAVEITESTMTYKQGGNSMVVTLTLQEQSETQATFQSPEADTVVLTLGEDGRLNTRSSKDDDFDHFYFSRQGADAEVAPSTNAVAYLDALKSCTPGDFHLSFPGVATLEATILGPKQESCELRIVHPDFALHCEYSARMIELLTSEKMYEDARSGVLSGSTDSEISQLAAEQCLPE